MICQEAWGLSRRTGTGIGTNGARRFFYCQDANYNVVALVENTVSGLTVRERYEYDPYGTVRIYKGWSSGAAAEQQAVVGRSLKWLDANLPENPILYCGYVYDSETGLNHVRHRTYNPQLGRWMQRDPAGYMDGANAYAYVRDCPVILADPNGLWGSAVHHDETVRIAGVTRMLPWAAEMVGAADERVDPPLLEWPFHTSLNTLSWHFDIPHDAQLSWGPSDSRFVHAQEQMRQAIVRCGLADAFASDAFVRDALEALGRGLHPVQDWVAHGTWDPTWRTLFNWRMHPDHTDDPAYDFVSSADRILRDLERDGSPPRPVNENDWDQGTTRITLTQARTMTYLVSFRESLYRDGYCYCRIYGG